MPATSPRSVYSSSVVTVPFPTDERRPFWFSAALPSYVNSQSASLGKSTRVSRSRPSYS
jgi:hypothetical protein